MANRGLPRQHTSQFEVVSVRVRLQSSIYQEGSTTRAKARRAKRSEMGGSSNEDEDIV